MVWKEIPHASAPLTEGKVVCVSKSPEARDVRFRSCRAPQRLSASVAAMPSHACPAPRLVRGFPTLDVTRRTQLSSRPACASSLVSCAGTDCTADTAGAASTGARGTAAASLSQPPLACVLSVPTLASGTVAFAAYLDWWREHRLSTRMLSVTTSTCCAPARHFFRWFRRPEPLLHGEQIWGHRRVDWCISRLLPQVYAASMLAVSPRARGARQTARQQDHGLSVRGQHGPDEG